MQIKVSETWVPYHVIYSLLRKSQSAIILMKGIEQYS